MCEHTPATPNPGEANLTTCCAHSVKRYTWRFPNLYSPMWIYKFIVIVILFIEEILQQLGRCYNFLNDWIMYQPQQVSAHFFHQPVGWLGTRCGMKCSLEKIDPSQVSGLQSCSASRYQIHWRRMNMFFFVVRLDGGRNPANLVIW